MTKLTDEELMQRVSNGNLDEMTSLFERYHLRIYNFLFQMLRDGQICEDLTQNVFYKVIRYRHSYKGGKFVSWIFKIARNNLADHFKQQQRKYQHVSLQNIKDETTTSSNNDDDIMHLYNAINMLTEEEKQLVIMNRIQEIKYDEIAEITGNSSGAIKVKMHRIIKKLRTHYFETN